MAFIMTQPERDTCLPLLSDDPPPVQEEDSEHPQFFLAGPGSGRRLARNDLSGAPSSPPFSPTPSLGVAWAAPSPPQCDPPTPTCQPLRASQPPRGTRPRPWATGRCCPSRRRGPSWAPPWLAPRPPQRSPFSSAVTGTRSHTGDWPKARRKGMSMSRCGSQRRQKAARGAEEVWRDTWGRGRRRRRMMPPPGRVWRIADQGRPGRLGPRSDS